MTDLDMPILAGKAAAFVGAVVGMMVLSGAIGPDPAGTRPSLDTRLTVGSFLLAAHAIACAALFQQQALGSCLAASLGAGWLGAAAAGLVAMMTRTEGLNRRMAAVAGRAVLGFALLAPLWAYVELIKKHAGMLAG